MWDSLHVPENKKNILFRTWRKMKIALYFELLKSSVERTADYYNTYPQIWALQLKKKILFVGQ